MNTNNKRGKFETIILIIAILFVYTNCIKCFGTDVRSAVLLFICGIAGLLSLIEDKLVDKLGINKTRKIFTIYKCILIITVLCCIVASVAYFSK